MSSAVESADEVGVAVKPHLEIGPRPDRLGPDWTTVGIEDKDYIDFKAAWGFGPLPFEDESFETFYSAHVIEHIPWWLTVPALKEAYRVLKPGGLIEIHTVNFKTLLIAYALKQPIDTWNCHGLNKEGHFMRWIASRLFAFGRSVADPNWHKAVFDAEYLGECLREAGFVDVTQGHKPRGPEKHGPINLGLRAVKPCI